MMKKIILLTLVLMLHARANDFAMRLYGELGNPPGNLFFSPASIESALAITRQGAGGITRKQFDFLLPQNIRSPRSGTHVTLESANALWVDQQFPILDPFKTAVTDLHQARIRTADFSDQPEVERQTINRWVREKTRDKIPDLLPAGSVSTMTRLILVNAIYFKGDWLYAFDPAQTIDAPFWISPEKSVPVPMMRLSGKRFTYRENDCFQTLELPYQGGEVSMILILPRQRDGLKPIEESFAAGNFESCLSGMHQREVNVFLPRFKVESTFASLQNNLISLGLTDAFDAQRADFSGISEAPLALSDVVHKAFVEVNEEGTEAAAATGIIMRTTSIGLPAAVFRADRPFIFLIRENKSAKILFIGRMCDPSK